MITALINQIHQGTDKTITYYPCTW